MNELERQKGLLEAYDFKIQPRETFETEAPVNLVLRAKEFPGAFVLWDLCDDETGFLVCGDDEAKLRNEWRVHHPDL